MLIDDFLRLLHGVKGGGGQWSAKCPGHDDQKASLRIGVADDGKILVKCQAGCDTERVLNAMGLTLKDLFIEAQPDRSRVYRQGGGAPQREPVITYDYGGGVTKHRRGHGREKQFWWTHVDKNTGRTIKKKPQGKLLYTAGEALEPGCVVFVVEGEKDVNTLQRLGLLAATGPDGAGPGKWGKADQDQLRDCRVRLGRYR